MIKVCAISRVVPLNYILSDSENVILNVIQNTFNGKVITILAVLAYNISIINFVTI